MKKIVISIFIFIMCSLLSGYLFHIFFQDSPKTQDSLNKILFNFSGEKIHLTKKVIESLSLSPTEKKFLNAVFLQQNQKLEQSNVILNNILEENTITPGSKKLNLLEETLALKILNHFLLNQKLELSRNIKKFQEHFPKSSLFPLIDAISTYNNDPSLEVINKISFSLFCYKQKNLNNSWFFHNLKHLIPSRVLLLKKAYNLLLIQKLDQAKTILNKELEKLFLNPSLWSDEDYQTIIILYCLSYFYEMKENPNNFLNYYESIAFYLEKLNSDNYQLYQKHFPNNILLFSCLEDSEKCAQKDLYPLAKTLFYHKKYSNLTTFQLIECIFTSIKHSQNFHTLIELLHFMDEFSEEENSYLNTFKQQFLEKFKACLINNSFEKEKYLIALGKDLIKIYPDLLDLISTQIVFLGKNMDQIKQWFYVLESFLNLEQFKIVSQKFFSYSKNLWEQGDFLFSLKLTEFILTKNLYNLNDTNLKEMSIFLEKVYSQAKENRDLNSLIIIESLKETYHLNINTQITTEALANLIADISYLYQQGNYLQAKKYCQWLLYLYPNSDKILELLAKSLFEEKNYTEALKHFSKISNKKLDTEHCIFACKELLKQQSQ